MRPLAVAAAAVAVLGCGGDGATAPRKVAPSLRVVAGGGTADTVLTPLDAPLVAEVRDTLGRPVAGAVVRFDVAPVAALAGTPRAAEAAAYVCASLTTSCGPDAVSTTLFDTTGADGRASAPVRLGTIAGKAKVYATADLSSAALRDSAIFTVQPGAAAQILLSPRDTVIYTAVAITPQAPVADRWGNARAEHAQLYSSVGAVHVGADGQIEVYGGQIGLFSVLAAYGAIRDTLHLVVVPHGRIVAYRADAPGGGAIVMANLDGSGYRAVVGTTGVNGAVYPSMSYLAGADGSIVYQEGTGPTSSRAMIIDSLGAAKRPITTDPALVATGYPRFSTSQGVVNSTGHAADGTVGVWAVGTDGTGARLTVALPALDLSPASAPLLSNAEDLVAYSPDGVELRAAYTASIGSGYSFGAAGQFLRWAPTSGRTLTLTGPGATGITLLDMLNGTSGFVGSEVGFDGPAEWSHDGSWLLAHVAATNQLALVRRSDGLTLPLLWSTGYSQASWVSP